MGSGPPFSGDLDDRNHLDHLNPFRWTATRSWSAASRRERSGMRKFCANRAVNRARLDKALGVIWAPRVGDASSEGVRENAKGRPVFQNEGSTGSGGDEEEGAVDVVGMWMVADEEGPKTEAMASRSCEGVVSGFPGVGSSSGSTWRMTRNMVRLGSIPPASKRVGGTEAE